MFIINFKDKIPTTKATAAPIRMESSQPILSRVLPGGFIRRVNQRTTPVIMIMKPTFRDLEKRDSNQSLKRIPITPVGIVTRMIQRRNLVYSRPLSLFFSVSTVPTRIFRISSRKKRITARRVPR